MKTSEILIKSRKYLWDGISDRYCQSRGLCWSIQLSVDAGHSSTVTRIKAAKIKRRIERSLSQYAFVSHWLIANDYAQTVHVNNPKIMQAYRHRWLDALITEYKSKGD